MTGERGRGRAPRAEGDAAPDWSRRVLDAHQEGCVVGGLDHEARSARAARARRRSGPAAARNPAFAHPLVCPSLLHRPRAERDARWPGCRRASPERDRRASRWTSADASDQSFDCDPVVDAAEHVRAERERDDGGDDEVDACRRARAARAEKSGVAERLDRRRQRVPPVEQIDDRGRAAAIAGSCRADRGSASGRTSGSSSAATRYSTSRKNTFSARDASASPADERDERARASGNASHSVARASGHAARS